MRALTHAVFALLVAGAGFALAGRSLHHDGIALAAALLGSLLPDVDAPSSLAGRLLRPAAAVLERWRHRACIHSLAALVGLALLAAPLGLRAPQAYAGLLCGWASHLLLDCVTPSGIRLLWPWRRACVLPGNPRCRPAADSPGERVLLALLVVLLLVTVPLSLGGGVWRSLRYLTGSQAGAYRDYQETTTQAVLDFRGRWAATHVPIAGVAPILDADAGCFVILLDGQVRRYGPRGDILPGRARVRATDQPIRLDTLWVGDQSWSWILARVPDNAWVSGRLVPDRAVTGVWLPVHALAVEVGSMEQADLAGAGAGRLRLESEGLPAARAPAEWGPEDASAVRVQTELRFEYLPAARLQRLRPTPAIDLDRVRTLSRRAASARASVMALSIRRPPAHYLEIRAAQAELAELEAQRRHLADPVVRFTGTLYLRSLPEDL